MIRALWRLARVVWREVRQNGAEQTLRAINDAARHRTYRESPVEDWH